MSENGAHGSTRPATARMNKVPATGRGRVPAVGGAGSVRIIGGRWRGTRLQVPHKPGLRPTADRVRETLFNWLAPVLAGARVLDLFAGSGALDALVDLPAQTSVQFLFAALSTSGVATPISNTVSLTPPANVADPDLDNNIASDGPDERGMFRDGFD